MYTIPAQNKSMVVYVSAQRGIRGLHAVYPSCKFSVGGPMFVTCSHTQATDKGSPRYSMRGLDSQAHSRARISESAGRSKRQAVEDGRMRQARMTVTRMANPSISTLWSCSRIHVGIPNCLLEREEINPVAVNYAAQNPRCQCYDQSIVDGHAGANLRRRIHEALRVHEL